MSLSWRKRRELRLGPDDVETLSERDDGSEDVTVILSNHFTRYTVVQPQNDATPEEELALARFQFGKVHGERAKDWEVRLSRPGEGGKLACAVDASLLARLKASFPAKGKARLVSVQPALMAAYNRNRGRIPTDGAWLLVAEPGRACLARLDAKGWVSVHQVPDGEVERTIERERSRAAGERLPDVVLKA